MTEQTYRLTPVLLERQRLVPSRPLPGEVRPLKLVAGGELPVIVGSQSLDGVSTQR